ncbi:MAG: ATP-binding protein [Holophagales bacterium]|nr:ATP-binding protein [Holophagales bacterium]
MSGTPTRRDAAGSVPPEPAASLLLVALDRAGMVTAGRVLRAFLESHGLGPRSLHVAQMAFEELVSNSLKHGGDGGAPPPGGARIEARLGSDSLELVLTDRGRAFDPTHAGEPAPRADLANAPIGGLGLRLVRSMATELRYARRSDENRTVVEIAIRRRV